PGPDGGQVDPQVGLADADLADRQDLGLGHGPGAGDPHGAEAEQRGADQVGDPGGQGEPDQRPAEDAPPAPHPGGDDGLAPLGDPPVGGGPPPRGAPPRPGAPGAG